MTTKLRVYEVARDLGMDNKALVNLLQSVGVSEVRNHMSAVAPEAIERVKRHLEKQKAQKGVEERIRPTVVKRRAASRPAGAADGSSSAPDSGVQPPESRGTVVRRVRPTETVPPKSAPRAAPAPVTAAPPEPPSAVASAPPPRSAPSGSPAPIESAPPSVAAPPSAPRHEPALAAPPAPSVTEAPRVEPVVEPTAAAPPAPSAGSMIPTMPAASEPVAAAPPVSTRTPAARPSAGPATASPVQAVAAPSPRPSVPRTGIDVWEGRPGVPMPQANRGPAPRRVQYDAKAPVVAGRSRGAPVRVPRGGMRQRGIGSLAKPKGTGQPVTQERSAHKKVVRIEESIGLQGLASKIGVKATEVLMKLMRMGMTGVNINSTLDADTAKLVANELGWEVEDVAVSEADALVAAQGLEAVMEEEAGRGKRPPVVTVMGHVDHGKTSLLDRIRRANVAAGEAGGITQHIGAYSVDTAHGKVTFLDTPGHEAFTAMRARGAQTTDVVVLVVAADDGVMPQTKEAVNHARAAKVPIVVAVNKIDKPEAQLERVRRELSEIGLIPEEWGGDTLFTEVSAATGQGVEALLEQIALQSEILELSANPGKPATGVVIEAELDRGRGPVATILITDGTLHRGDVILAGATYGKMRAMHDHLGRSISEAGPSTPVEIIGLNDVPSAGDPVHVIKDIKKAQEIGDSRKVKERKSLMPAGSQTRMTLEDLAKAMSESDQLELKLIIKADVQGSVEALADALIRLSTQKVKVSVVHSAAGAITEGDVNLAVAAGAIIIGFNVRPAGKASGLAQKEGIQIRQYSVIYNVVDEVKAAMEGLLAPTLVEKQIGRAEVRQVFKVSKAGTIAGCMVLQGLIRRNASARLVRDGSVIFSGKISSLKRFKDDAREVKEGFDCGIGLENYGDLKEGDSIEAFEMEQVKQTL